METAGWPTGHMATAVTSQKEWKVQVLGTLHVHRWSMSHELAVEIASQATDRGTGFGPGGAVCMQAGRQVGTQARLHAQTHDTCDLHACAHDSLHYTCTM